MMSILREKFRFQTGVKEQKIVHTYESHTKTPKVKFQFRLKDGRENTAG